MDRILLLRLLWLGFCLSGLPALVQQSGLGASSGLSAGRAGLLVLTSVAWLAGAAGGGWAVLSGRRADWCVERGSAWFSTSGRRPVVTVSLLFLGVVAWEGFVFSFMFWPEYLRWLSAWGGVSAMLGLVWLGWGVKPAPTSRESIWPRPANLDSGQKRALLILCLVGLAYFGAFIPANLRGAEDAGRLLVHGGDEVVIYPIVTTMLTTAPDLRTTLYRLIEYDDYHYGYPFYLLSALVLLPVRLAAGNGFAELTQINLPLLRQLISLLPMILAALVFTYLGTRFRSLAGEVLLFVLILSIPGVVHNGLRFWHPDGLTVLFIALTFFYLERDRLRLGRNFYMAALFCGLATAVRLMGFFFVLAVAGYLLASWLRQRSLARLLVNASGFITVMALTILVSNPFLFDTGARGRMLDIMGEKSGELSQGYREPDPENVYRTGWTAWQPFFEKEYAQTWFSLFLLVSAAAGALAGRERDFPALLLGWSVMMGGYLIFFVAVKAFQYSLPLFMPLYAAGLYLPQLFADGGGLPPGWITPATRKVAWALSAAACLAQLAFHIAALV